MSISAIIVGTFVFIILSGGLLYGIMNMKNDK